MGSYNSVHNKSAKSVVDVMNIQKNRLRLTATIESVRWLSLQACGLRDHDESSTSQNCGNFIEMLKLLGKWNASIDDVILEKAPGNAKYTSPEVQKEILHIIGNRVRNKIRAEIGDSKFCILVDEAKDISNKEQMAIILRFVDAHGFLRDRFFQIVHVHDTTAATLKKEICDVLTRYNLEIHNIRGQGYDGASNMCGAFNGLQALFLKDCPYAYYIHCFAHRLQLALVAAAENEISIWLFFSNLTTIVNLVTSSSKRNAELQSAQVNEITRSVVPGERETGRGANQIGTLHRVGTTRWSSHFDSICDLIDKYNATINVLENIIIDGSSTSMRGEAVLYFNVLLQMLHAINCRYYTDPSGTFWQCNAKAIGSGSEGADSSLQEQYNKDLSLLEAETIALSILKQVMEEKVTPNNVDIAKVAPTYHLYTPAEVKDVISRL
ncbi:zinc finger MYM-type protein 1-like [Zingiber officinale]|uniref:zinc finger MYM-type protein 1-like n=2 Tax=Zingiber officinale TaxID=94328 RepID=UPI001C4DA32B|nr:zinc finger MYM-type protein 1-like [Zingiber officinale]